MGRIPCHSQWYVLPSSTAMQDAHPSLSMCRSTQPGHARTNSSVSAMQPPCYHFLDEITILGVTYGGLVWRVCNLPCLCVAARRASASISAMRPPCYPCLEETAILGAGTCWGMHSSHLDLSRAPYVLYGAKYIDLVSLHGGY